MGGISMVPSITLMIAGWSLLVRFLTPGHLMDRFYNNKAIKEKTIDNANDNASLPRACLWTPASLPRASPAKQKWKSVMSTLQ